MFILIKKLNLTAKFVTPLLMAVLISLLVGAVLVLREVDSSTRKNLDLARSALETEQNSAEEVQRLGLESKADIIGRFMAKTAPDLIVSYDFTSLSTFQEEAVSDPEVLFAAYLKPDGTPFTEYARPDGAEVLEKTYPIELDGEVYGSVLLGMRLGSVTDAIAASTDRINSAIERVKASSDESQAQFLSIIIVTIAGVLAMIGGVMFLLFRKLIVTPLRETSSLIEDLGAGQGDLTVRLPVRTRDEIGRLSESVNTFIDQLHGMIETIVSDVETLSDEALHLRQFGAELSSSSEQQRGETTLVATAMNEMAATVQEVARHANEAAGATEQAAHEAESGSGVVQETIQSIDSLATEVENATNVIGRVQQDSDSIGAVLDVIKGIAEQTNLLALNAAIEAARAGEQGRGFAVVADEVRTLASRTQESTAEIQEMIERLQIGAMDAVQVMEQSRNRAKQTVEQAASAGRSLADIAAAVTRINDMNAQIASAAEEQSAVAGEIDKNVVSINSISESTAAGAERTAQSSERLSQLTVHLRDMVGQFRL